MGVGRIMTAKISLTLTTLVRKVGSNGPASLRAAEFPVVPYLRICVRAIISRSRDAYLELGSSASAGTCTVRQPIAHQSAVLVEVLLDQFESLGLVLDNDHWGARCLRDLSLEVTLLAHGSKNSRIKIS